MMFLEWLLGKISKKSYHKITFTAKAPLGNEVELYSEVVFATCRNEALFFILKTPLVGEKLKGYKWKFAHQDLGLSHNVDGEVREVPRGILLLAGE